MGGDAADWSTVSGRAASRPPPGTILVPCAAVGAVPWERPRRRWRRGASGEELPRGTSVVAAAVVDKTYNNGTSDQKKV